MMMNTNRLAALLLTTLAGLPLAASAAGNAEAGAQKSLVCGACHGVDGNSINPEWPNLALPGRKTRANIQELSKEVVLAISHVMSIELT